MAPVVLIGGIIALIIGGPIAWIVFAAALIVLADTLAKCAQGKASLLDVGLAAPSCIPCTKGLTTLAELSDACRAGGLLGAGGHLLVSGKNAAIGFLRTAQRLRVGLAPGVTAIFASLGDAGATAAKADGLERLTAFYGEINLRRAHAVRDAWTRYIDQVGGHDPAGAASCWQGHDSYPGRDPEWVNVLGRDGLVVEAAVPGLGNFVVPDGTFASTGFDAALYTVPDGTFAGAGNDAATYNAGVQVGPSSDPRYAPYRPSGVHLRINNDLDVASSTALANPQYGPGGLAQHYVPGFDAKLVSGDIQIVDGSGHVVPVTPDPVTGLPVYSLPAGAEIPLSNFTTMPPLPSLQAVAAGRPVIHQTVPRIVGTAWTAGSETSAR